MTTEQGAPAPVEAPAPGIYPSVPAERYHAIQAMSAGGLKRMRQSPAHYFGMQLDPNRPPPGEPTPAMKNGTLVHCWLFEPDQVEARYVIKPDGLSMATKEGKAWRAALPDGIEVVDAAQMLAARRQAESIRALPDVGALLDGGVGESSVFWIDEETGELCKCRPDWVSPTGDGFVLLDGKTTSDASPEGFARASWNMDYALQAAWYSDGYAAATGRPVHGFVFAVAESSWPHLAAAYMLDDEVLSWARRENRRLLNLYAQCRRSGVWPGYPQEVQPIQMPAWAMKEIQE